MLNKVLLGIVFSEFISPSCLLIVDWMKDNKSSCGRDSCFDFDIVENLKETVIDKLEMLQH